jgi:peroxiredoxin
MSVRRTFLLLTFTVICCFFQIRDTRASAIELSDVGGHKHSLTVSNHDKAAVLFFSGAQCPACRKYLPRVVALANKYSSDGVAFFAVYSNAQDAPSEIAQQALDSQATFPFLLDPDQKAADAFHVQATPTAVLIDSQGLVRYRGVVDDNKEQALTGKHYLQDAIEAVLAGKDVPVASTKTLGCRIQRKLVPDDQSSVTYASQVAEVLNEHCVVCHRPGQLGPFPLQTY